MQLRGWRGPEYDRGPRAEYGLGMATVFIPSLMQALTNGEDRVEVQGSTVRQIIENLDSAHPGVKVRLVEENRIKSGFSVAVDGEINPLGMLSKVQENSEVHFLPAIGGGGGPHPTHADV